MGGIIGSGIFVNPHVVAQQVHTNFSILGAWALGGLIALAGAFVYAELATLRPNLVVNMPIYDRAVTFARYAKEILATSLSEKLLAVLALTLLTIINCFGVRFGTSVQSTLMVLKLGAIAGLLTAGFAAVKVQTATVTEALVTGGSVLSSFGAGVVPVLFAYGGWQTASFMTGEMRNPKRDLARGLLFGVIGVTAICLSVNVVCLRVLGADGLAATSTPAFTVMERAIGSRGALFMALAITVSTLGFLSQGMLTAPRVYFAMARDGLFFQAMSWLPRGTRVPVAAIAS